MGEMTNNGNYQTEATMPCNLDLHQICIGRTVWSKAWTELEKPVRCYSCLKNVADALLHRRPTSPVGLLSPQKILVDTHEQNGGSG